MKFECGDLERALAMPELMPEAREHLKHCNACRREFRVWSDISTAAKELHEQWESPKLWSNIQKTLEAEPRAKSQPVWWKEWKAWAVAACVIAAAGLLLVWNLQRNTSPGPPPDGTQIAPLAKNRDFLTEQALREVESTEAAYRRSIDKLSQLAEPDLKNPVSAIVVNYKEKLLMLDSAISETRTNLEHNRFNMRLQTDLADLYREKQRTLKELLIHDQKN